MAEKPDSKPVNRRQFVRTGLRGAAALGLAGVAGTLARRRCSGETVWQLDPGKCVQCGRCETACVVQPSAVKCFHTYQMCGYCRLCFGYFQPAATRLTRGPENELCPTGAINRKFIEDPYHEYSVDESLCIGCGICVKGCNTFGNGSLFLQVSHNHCVNCNECAIASACPAGAFRRVPVTQAYLLKGGGESS